MASFEKHARDPNVYLHIVKQAIPIRVRDCPKSKSKSRVSYADKGLFAAKAIEAYQEVFRESKPMVKVVHEDVIEATCDNCFVSVYSTLNLKTARFNSDIHNKAPELSPCPKCKCVWYCSVKCEQEALASHHKFECGPDLGKKLREVAHPAQRALIRFLLRYQGGKISKRLIGTFLGAYTLSMELAVENCNDQVKAEAETAKRLAGSDMASQDVLRLYLRLMMAMKPVYTAPQDSWETKKGGVLHFYSSFINHSCDPNMTMFCEGQKIRYRSLRKIDAKEELTIAYVSVDWDVRARRDILMREYTFLCKCARCLREAKLPRIGNDRLDLITTGDQLAAAETVDDVESVQEELRMMLHSPPFTKETPRWPDHVEPMPSILESMARAYLQVDATPGKVAAIHLKNCFVHRRLMFHGMVGSGWIQSLFEVVMAVSDIVFGDMDTRGPTGKVELARWQLYMLYLGHLRQEAKKWYGRDSKLWRAIQRMVEREFARPFSKQIGFQGDLPAALGEQKKLFMQVGIPQAKGFEMLEEGKIEQYPDEASKIQAAEDTLASIHESTAETILTHHNMREGDGTEESHCQMRDGGEKKLVAQ